MRVAVAAGPGRTALLQELAEDGTGHGRAVMVNDLPAAVAGYERAGAVRWVWADTPGSYPPLLRAGMRVDRCHDVTLVEALLRARDGSPAEPPVPSAPRPPEIRGTQQPALWGPAETALPEAQDALRALVTAHAGQVRRIAADPHPARFGLLAAVESAGGLAAAEMRARGMPWRADVHDALLADLLGPRPVAGVRPARLAALAKDISAAFGGRPVNPDSPAQLAKAFAADGIRIASTRAGVLRDIEHPAVGPLLEYKELARLHSAHGWAWLDEWVHDGRFCPEYLVGGVVSGRWATRGGGALQIPRLLRRAAIADPGWALVVADAAQLEPRVLAALAGDHAFAEAAGQRGSVPGPGRRVRRRPGQGQGRPAVCHVRRRGGRGIATARRVAAPVPAGGRLRGGGRAGGGGGPRRPVPARPDLPATLGRVARAHRVRRRAGL